MPLGGPNFPLCEMGGVEHSDLAQDLLTWHLFLCDCFLKREGVPGQRSKGGGVDKTQTPLPSSHCLSSGTHPSLHLLWPR